jgi:hypothetical protein
MAVLLGSVGTRKPTGTIISLVKAREIAYNWHGGQWSPLYSFASSYKSSQGTRFAWLSVIGEIEDILMDKGKGKLTPKDKKELNALKKFMLYKRYEERKEFFKDIK